MSTMPPERWVELTGGQLRLAADRALLHRIAALAVRHESGAVPGAAVDAAVQLLQRAQQWDPVRLRGIAGLLLSRPADVRGSTVSRVFDWTPIDTDASGAGEVEPGATDELGFRFQASADSGVRFELGASAPGQADQARDAPADGILGMRLRGQVAGAAALGVPIRLGSVGVAASSRSLLEVEQWFVLPADRPIAAGIAGCLGALVNPFSLAEVSQGFQRDLLAVRVVADGSISIAGRFKAGLAADAARMAEGTLGVQARFRMVRSGRFRLLTTPHPGEAHAIQLGLEQVHRNQDERGLALGLTLELPRLMHDLRARIIEQADHARDLLALLDDFLPPSRAIRARIETQLDGLGPEARAALAQFAGGSPEAPAIDDLVEAIAAAIDARAELWGEDWSARSGTLAQGVLDDLLSDQDPSGDLRDLLRPPIEDALAALHGALRRKLTDLAADEARFEPLRRALETARKLPRRARLDHAAARLDAVAEPVRAVLNDFQHNLAQLVTALDRAGAIKAHARWRRQETTERGRALTQRLVFRPGGDPASRRFIGAAQLYRRALTGSFHGALDAALDASGDPRHAPVELLEGSLREFASLRRESAFEIMLLDFQLQRRSLLDARVEIDTDAAGNVLVLGRAETLISWRRWWEARSFRGINVFELASARATRRMTFSLSLNHDDKRLKPREVQRFFEGLEDARIGLLPAGSAARAMDTLRAFSADDPGQRIEGELRVELALDESALQALLQLDRARIDAARVYRAAINALVDGREVTGSREINNNLARYARRHDGSPTLRQLLLDLGDASKRLSLIDPTLEEGGQFDHGRDQVQKVARLAEDLGSALQDMRDVYQAPTTWDVDEFNRRQARIGETLGDWARGEPAGRGLAEVLRNDSVRPGMLALFKTIAELAGAGDTPVAASLLLRAAERTRELRLVEPQLAPPSHVVSARPRQTPAAAPAADSSTSTASAGTTTTAEIRAMADYIFPLPSRPDRDFEAGGRAFRSRRSGGKRWHAGCDLIKSTDTPVLAMADGEVVRGPYYFYSNTYALEIKHRDGRVVRYGEIKKRAPKGVRVGAQIKQGDVIGWVGRLKSGSQMLHLEMYKGTHRGRLTRSGANRYMRRADVMDPTDILKRAPLLSELQAPAKADQPGAAADTAARAVAGKVNQSVPGSLNLREAQRLDADVLGELARGTRVEILRSMAGDPHPFGDHITWYEVRAVDGACEGRTGFVVGHFVTPEGPLGDIPKAEPAAFGRVNESLSGSLRVRESPWLHAKQTGKLERGDTLEVLDADVDGDNYRWDRDDWMRVKLADGGEGYVAGYFVDILDEDPKSAGKAFGQQPSTEDLPDELTATLLQTATSGASSRTASASGIGIGGVSASQQMALQDLEDVKRHADRFRSVAGKAGIPAALLAAIASRESRCGRALKNGWGDNGNGYGVLQVDKRHHKLRGLGDPFSTEHLEQGAAILNEKMFRLNRKFPNWEQDYRLMGAVAAYNFGVGNVRSKEGINRGTAGDDYGADVIARAQFYHRHDELEIFRA